MSTIQERLQIVKDLRGVKNRDIAKALNISDAAVSRFCSGVANPSGQTMDQIAEKFNVDRYWLRTGNGKPQPDGTKAAQEEAVKLVAQAMRDADPRYRDKLIELIRSTEPWIIQACCQELIRWAAELEQIRKEPE